MKKYVSAEDGHALIVPRFWARPSELKYRESGHG